MEYLAVLSQTYPTLASEELATVLGNKEQWSTYGDAVCFTAPRQDFSRLALTKEVARLVDVFDKGDYDCSYGFDGSFAVRCTRLDQGQHATQRIEERIGETLQEATGNPVDLDDPDVLFRAYLHGENVLLGRVVHRRDMSAFDSRKNDNRPFRSPVSLHPRLARALVNLAGVSPGDTVLDPFCGTGGILIEAGLIGLTPYGLDSDAAMLDGCRTNLEAYGIEAELRQGDARELSEHFDNRFDAIVSDLPYGRASQKQGAKRELVSAFLQEAQEVCDGTIVWIVDDPSLLPYEPVCELYVHGTLSRYVYRLS